MMLPASVKFVALTVLSLLLTMPDSDAATSIPETATPPVIVDTAREPVAPGIVLGVPTKTLALKFLGKNAGTVTVVEQLGSGETVRWTQGDQALSIEPPSSKPASDAGVVYKITLSSNP